MYYSMSNLLFLYLEIASKKIVPLAMFWIFLSKKLNILKCATGIRCTGYIPRWIMQGALYAQRMVYCVQYPDIEH